MKLPVIKEILIKFLDYDDDDEDEEEEVEEEVVVVVVWRLESGQSFPLKDNAGWVLIITAESD